MRQLLETQISEQAFKNCWNNEAPPYPDFLDAVAQRLSAMVSDEIEELSTTIKAWGDNRVRIDGHLRDKGIVKTFNVEVVWLSASGTYRGTASVRDTPPEPAPKSVDQFILELDAILNDEQIIFDGQVFNAMKGIDEESEAIRVAYPAIFRLFERFPDEGFGSPGHLVHLMEERGQYEHLLMESMRRSPSIPAIYMAYGMARSASTEEAQSHWWSELSRIARSPAISKGVVDYTVDLLKYHSSLTNTEPGGREERS